ncbi:ACR3 family arsenite efflux transporter [Flavobacterium sp.]|uniref:ACR3 family arsenite efflux transporter n=1 Tax=Flavobacterium sp. TaxID=239 RepID=UPI002616A132|nr:ACR3 family arsenite efflux transporter [Flavobacterium sp.]
MRSELKFTDRNLTVLIFFAMAIGIGLGHFIPAIPNAISTLSVGATNIPLAIGLLLMLYPPLAKVDYSLLPMALKNRKVIGISLLLNWVVGPLLMFVIAILFLADEPEYRSGLILIGLARCIAMVLVWNDLAKGNNEYAALLVALNSIFQILMYGFFVWLFITVLPEKLGLANFSMTVAMDDVMQSVLLYLGVPFLAGFLSRYWLIKFKGIHWYNRKFIPRIAPVTLYALLFTIVVMFSLNGAKILELPADVITIAIPLTVYFVLMFMLSFSISKKLKIPYSQNAAIAFTASGNNFELAIAISIAVFGVHSPQAFVGVIGPLVEVPVLIALVKVSLWLKKNYYP